MLAITGATGFIGSRVAAAAAADGQRVRALLRRPAALPEGVDPFLVDYEDAASLRKSLAGVSALCHLAAHVPADMSDPREATTCFAVNAIGALRMLEAARDAGVSRFVATSSGNAYAFSPEPVKENAPLFPAARAPYYLASKVAGDIFVAHFTTNAWLRGATLRLSSVYGPGMSGVGLIPTLASRLLRKETVVLRNAGAYACDFVFVEDVVTAVLRALDANVVGVLNIGLGRRVLIDEVAAALADLCGASQTLLQKGADSDPPDIGFAALDITRARSTLQFRPTLLRDGLRAYVASLTRS